MKTHGPGPIPGWKPTPSTTASAVPPSFPLDDGEDWWAGSQLGFVSIPIAGALAALGVYVAIATSFIEPPDEFPFPDSRSGHETYQVIPVGEEPRFTAFSADDDFVPRAFDECEWQPPLTDQVSVVIVNWPITGAGSFPAEGFSPEETEWSFAPKTAPPVVSKWLGEDETVPQPIAFVEEIETPVFVPKPVLPLITQWLDQDEVVTQPSAMAAEDEWQVFTPSQSVPAVRIWTGEDEVVPQPTFHPEEDYWYQQATDQTLITVVNWPITGAGSFSPAVFVPNELYWFTLQPQPPLVVFKAFSADDEIIPAAVPAGTGAAAYPPPSQRLRHTPQIRSWETVDEVPTPAVPLGVDEVYWQYFPPQVVLPTITLWQVEDEWQIPPAPLVADGFDWQVFTPDLEPKKFIYAPDQAGGDEIVPNLLVDESDWPDFARTVLVTALPLYLPDPEEIPAGTLLIPPTPPEEQHHGGGHGGKKKKKPKYQVDQVYLRDKLEIEKERQFLQDVETRIKELAGIVEKPAETKKEVRAKQTAEIGLLARVDALASAYSVELASVKEAVKLIEKRKLDLMNEEALAIILIAANL